MEKNVLSLLVSLQILKPPLSQDLNEGGGKEYVTKLLESILQERPESSEVKVETSGEKLTSLVKEAMRKEMEGGNTMTVITRIVDYFYLKLTEDQKLQAEAELWSSEDGGFFRTILIDILKLDQTIAKTRSHLKFIRKSYKRFQDFFPNVTEQQIAEHDKSKFDFVELIGYTAR